MDPKYYYFRVGETSLFIQQASVKPYIEHHARIVENNVKNKYSENFQ